jgi:outer membrane protein assembly factor BamB
MAGRSTGWKAGWVSAVGLCVALIWPAGGVELLRMVRDNRQSVIRQIWHVPGEGRGIPAADRSTAYFLSKRHEVLAVDATNGVQRWRASTVQAGDATWGSLLLLTDRLVIAGDFDVVAFDRANGAVRWRFSPIDGYGPGIYLGTAAGGAVFTGSPAGRVYAIDQRSGMARWSALVADDGGTTVFQPATDRDLVVAGYTTFTAPPVGGVVALDAGTGRQRWRASFPRGVDTSLGTGWAGGPIFVDDFIVATSGDGQIHAFHRSDGEISWSFPRAGPCVGAVGSSDRDFRPLAHAGRTVFAGSLTGCLVAYDVDTHRERWKHPSEEDGSTASTIAADNEALYVPYARGRIAEITIDDGAVRWSTGAQQRGFRWPPAIVGDRLYLASSLEGFYAFQR